MLAEARPPLSKSSELDDTSEDDLDYFSRQREWEKYNNAGITVFKPGDDNNSAFQVKGSRTRVEKKEMCKIKKGDHIAWHRPSKVYWHHAIVVNTDENGGRLSVIHYSKKEGRFAIHKEWISLDEEKGDLFVIEYSSDNFEENSTYNVLRRARALKDGENYNLFLNNCEHFATYCKTGIKDSTQIRWASWKLAATGITTAIIAADKYPETARKRSHSSVTPSGRKGIKGVKAGCKSVKSVGKQSRLSTTGSGRTDAAGVTEVIKCGSKTLEAVATGVIASPGTVIAAACKSAAVAGKGIDSSCTGLSSLGAGLVVATEVCHCAYDIYKLNKIREQDKMTKQDFKITVTQRVSECAFGATGAVVGAYAGGLVGGCLGSCIPVAGTAVGQFVGSVVGGAVGSVVGKALGSVFGGWLGNALF